MSNSLIPGSIGFDHQVWFPLTRSKAARRPSVDATTATSFPRAVVGEYGYGNLSMSLPVMGSKGSSSIV